MAYQRKPMPEREWEPKLVSLCNPEPPEPCDCGYVGEWEFRPWFRWHDYNPTAKERREAKRVLPVGWWIIGGFEERCPGCGDIERFDEFSNLIESTCERADVIRFIPRARP